MLIALIVFAIFALSLFVQWWYKRDDLTYKDQVTIVAFWFMVCVLIKVIGLGN